MSNLKKTTLLMALSLLFCATMPAQNVSTQGKEFWVSFMTNGFRTNTNYGPPWVKTQVLISAKRSCAGTISNPNTDWSQTFFVEAGNITSIDIPENVAYHADNQNESVQNHGLKVVTTDTVSVYCTNIANNSFDASYVLPIHALADDYIAQCCKQSATGSNYRAYETSSILIVATQNATTIDITPSIATLGGHPANTTFTIDLNAGQSYQIRSNVGQDLSGTRITARDCDKIAVFNGNTLTCVPETMDNGYDHVFEQTMPLRSWGKNFVVTGSKDRNRDFVKITSSADDNVILKNGERFVTLQANQSHYFELNSSEASCYLEATQPSAVFMYNNSSYDQSWNGGNGDPSMVWIAPVEQRIDDVTFATFTDVDAPVGTHYVNIIVKTEDVALVYFDDQQISPLLFSHVNGNDEYSYVRMHIEHGVHHLSCVHGFNAHVYGFGPAKGYAYLVGSNASDLNCSLIVNDLVVRPNGTFSYCIEEPVVFSAEINYQQYELQWDFGDGNTSTQNPTTHTYNTKDLYHAKLIVHAEGGGCYGDASDTISFVIDVMQHYATPIEREICAGEGFHESGFNIPHILQDTVFGFLQDNATFPNCQDSVFVYITTHPTYHPHINDSRCWKGYAEWYTANGFSFQYTEPDTYERELHLQTVNGCDSIVSLTLTVAQQIEHSFSDHCCEPTYYWDGEAYTEAGVFMHTYTTADGCDSTVYLNLTFGTPQSSEFWQSACHPIEWAGITYYETGEYRHTFDTFDGCDSIVTAHFTISSEVFADPLYMQECDSVEFHQKYYYFSGLYYDTIPSYMDCDSITPLQIDMNYVPQSWGVIAKDTIACHWVIPSSEFQVNQYSYHISNKLNYISTWDSIVWHLETRSGEAIDWIAEPFASSPESELMDGCHVYVLNYTTDTVDLHATVYNRCSPEGIDFSHWLVCSSYDVEEHQAKADFNILPNPNQGEMILLFENYTGKATLKIVDMRGNIIDSQSLHIDAGTRRPYTLRKYANGIYYFVLSLSNEVITKKVVVFN